MEVAAGIIIKDNEVLLLKRAEGEDHSGLWVPVNETIEEGETPEEAVIRGVREEVGLKFFNIKFFFQPLFWWSDDSCFCWRSTW